MVNTKLKLANVKTLNNSNCTYKYVQQRRGDQFKCVKNTSNKLGQGKQKARKVVERSTGRDVC